jgi:hypothetical protein
MRNTNPGSPNQHGGCSAPPGPTAGETGERCSCRPLHSDRCHPKGARPRSQDQSRRPGADDSGLQGPVGEDPRSQGRGQTGESRQTVRNAEGGRDEPVGAGKAWSQGPVGEGSEGKAGQMRAMR